MRRRGARRLILDLTPLIDVIMILLFGVMIHSVAKTEVDTTAARGVAVAAEDKAASLAKENRELAARLAAAEEESVKSRAERDALAKARRDEKEYLADWVAGLLLLADDQRTLLRSRFENISPADLARLKEARADSGAIRDVATVQKAIRRIEEMEKVFTFVDLHLGADDFLAISANGRPVERLAVRELPAEQIERDLRRSLEAVNFSQTVLVLFSYDGEARVLSAQATETAINAMLDEYRSSASGQGKQFRYAKVGRLDSMEPKREPGPVDGPAGRRAAPEKRR